MRAPLLLVVLALVACERVEPPAPAPPAEFIIAAADSVFWVRSDAEGIRVRGAPMVLAQVGGRFSEVYAADDDYSFYDAVFVGQRLFKRDLISGDSVQLFSDTLMPLLARGYAAANPDERPLNADEQGNENPRTVATADVMALDVHGPWLSYEYRTDVDVIGGPSSHGTRRGMIDLRTGAVATLESLFGGAAARRLTSQGREQWRVVRDSLAPFAVDSTAEEFVDVARLAFDPRSFMFSVEDRAPRLRFAVVQSAALKPSGVLEMDPIPVVEPTWWASLRFSFPIEERPGERVWQQKGFTVVGRPAETPVARVAFALRDAAGTEWRLGSLPSPVLRVMWLGDSSDASGTRQALTKAFNDAAFYSEDARIVRHQLHSGRASPLLWYAARTTPAPVVPRRLPKARPRS